MKDECVGGLRMAGVYSRETLSNRLFCPCGNTTTLRFFLREDVIRCLHSTSMICRRRICLFLAKTGRAYCRIDRSKRS